MTTVVTGLYADAAAADRGVARLVAEAIPSADISVILASTPDHERIVQAETDDTPRGAVTGAVGGGVLASLAFATLALPGVGVLVTGPLFAALAAGSVGALAGGIIGGLTGYGVSTTTAQEYERAIHRGEALVAVHTVHEEAKAVKGTLLATGAKHVSDAVHFARPAEKATGELD